MCVYIYIYIHIIVKYMSNEVRVPGVRGRGEPALQGGRCREGEGHERDEGIRLAAGQGDQGAVYIYIYIYIHTYVYTYICTYVCMCIYIYI